MTKYKIYTENKNIEAIRSMATIVGGNMTLYSVKGVFNFQSEDSLVIEVIGEDSLAQNVFLLAKQIKLFNKQEAVLVTRESVVGITI